MTESAKPNKGGAPKGNNNGAKGRPFYNQLRKILAQDDLKKPETQRHLHKIAMRLIRAAEGGEEWAIKELANRLDGKAIQGVAMVTPDGAATSLIAPSALRGLAPEELGTLQSLLHKAGAAIGEEEEESDPNEDLAGA